MKLYRADEPTTRVEYYGMVFVKMRIPSPGNKNAAADV